MERHHVVINGGVASAPGWVLRAGALVLVLSCGGSHHSATSTQAPNDLARVESELDGAGWRLTDFQPDLRAGPILGPLLSQQMGQLVLHFDHGQMHADSPSLHATRTYQVVDAAGPMFRFAMPDEGGLMVYTSARLSEDHERIVFHVDNEPFRGSGVLERVR